MFDLHFNFTVFNPHEYDIMFTFGGDGKNFLANIITSLENKRLETYLEGPGLFHAVITEVIFTNGYTNRTTNQIIGFSQLGYNQLPDGKYICEIYALNSGNPLLNSSQTMLIIDNGISSIDYYYLPTINLGIQRFDIYCSILILTYLIFYIRKKNRK